MLSFDRVTLRRGSRLLYRDVSLRFDAGNKVGITGSNGVGKSSLLDMVRGDLGPDTGQVDRPKGLQVASVAQEVPVSEASAIDFVIDGDTELRELERNMLHAERSGDGHLHGELLARFETISGYSAYARAARLLDGLGFSGAEQLDAVNHFSGGWRMRLALARALMCRSELLLLDEPTNHLDLDAVLWLADWLEAYSGTLLLISHDREFLDQIVDRIIHIENETVELYAGNYTAMERQRAARLAQQQALHDKQQREIARVGRFVERFRYKASKAKQVQSRLRTLERLEQVAPAHVRAPFHFSFKEPEKIPAPLVALEDVSAGYGEHTVLESATLAINPGDRIGLLGPNGAGKSTLIKCLAGTITTRTGDRLAGKGITIGHFAQDQLEHFVLDESPLWHLRRIDRHALERELRDFLGGFGFSGDRVFEPVEPFSSGERARLLLALIVYQRPALLLLDEPTNHLDLEMRHALTVALQEFSGALVLVSHDRFLMQAATDQLLLLHNGRIEEFDGDLEDYARWLRQSRQARAGSRKDPEKNRRRRRQLLAERRRLLQPLRQELAELDEKLQRLTEAKLGVETELGDSKVYEENNRDQLARLIERRTELEDELEEIESQWLAASERLETTERRLEEDQAG